jgi:hypothetical protein
MDKGTSNTEGLRKAVPAKRGTCKTLPLENIYQKNGHFDGKLFHAKDTMTYTFLFQGEVIVLHFDKARRCLFLKGHRISDLTNQPDLVDHLKRFKMAMLADPEADGFVQAFGAVLAGLCAQAGLEPSV